MAEPGETRFATHMLPAQAFPFTILAYNASEAADLFRLIGPTSTVPGGLAPVWEKTVERPPQGKLGALYIPPLHKEHGPVVIVVRWDNPGALVEPQQMFWPGCTCEHEHSAHDHWKRCAARGCTCKQYTPTVPKEELN